MNDDLKARARAIFLELSTLDGPGVGDELDRLVGQDRELRDAVASLLDAREGANNAGLLSATTLSHPSARITESAGSIIGPYKVLQLIGEGGFGSVFLAEQAEPVRRRVALKIIKLGMDTRQVIARFEAERQALALMDHPHIARVFDAGATESGRPYFAMEYVVGDAITTFADDYKLDIEARLVLLSQVCSAVQHAHTKGVIHRDLKPANVLVSMVDGKPFAKVIDFGIAKATASPLTSKTLFTEHRQLIGTPEYMSPEQAEGSPDIDTRTDVYALGVLMYELLTGVTPFDAKRLRSAVWAELQRIIREEEPPIPSVRLSRDAALSQRTAASRQIEPPRLASTIRGELDWIVMKALDKDRARRYSTPSELAQDIGHHLAGEAVEAAPPSAGYRLRKVVVRNKGAVIATGAVGASLIIGIIGTGWGWLAANRANRQLNENWQVSQDALSTITEMATDGNMTIGSAMNPGEAGHDSAVRTIADVAVHNVKKALELRDQLQRQSDVASASIADAVKRIHESDLALDASPQVPGSRDWVLAPTWSADGFALNKRRLVDGTPGPLVPLDPDEIFPAMAEYLSRSLDLAVDTNSQLLDERNRLAQQAQQARDGVGAMLGILVYGEPGGPIDSIDPSTGKSMFEQDPLGSAVSFGIDLATSLKEERDRLQNQADIARDGLAEISRVLYACDCDPQEAPGVGEAAVSAWVSVYGDMFPKESQDELRLRAVMAYAQGNARSLVTARSEAEWSAYTANLALAQNAMDAGDWPGARESLAKCPENKRGWEWRFLDRRARYAAFSVSGEAWAGFSPDGKRIATFGFSSEGTYGITRGAQDTTLRIHDLDGDRDPVILTAPAGGTLFMNASTVSWSPDGKRIIAIADAMNDSGSWSFSAESSGGTLGWIWNTDGSGEPVVIRGPEGAGALAKVAWSPDSSSVAIALANVIRIWNAAAPDALRVIRSTSFLDTVNSLAFSPDGSRLALNGHNRLACVALNAGNDEPQYVVDAGLSHSIAWSPDGEYLATQTEGVLQVRRSSDGALVATLEGHTYSDGWSRSYALSHWTEDGRLAQPWRHGIVFSWDIPQSGGGTPEFDTRMLAKDFGGLSPDGSRMLDGLAFYRDNVPDMIVADAGNARPPVSWILGDSDWQGAHVAAEAGVFGPWPNGRMSITIGERAVQAVGRLVQFIDDRGQPIASFKQDDVVTGLLATPDGARLLIGLQDGKTIVWDIRDPVEIVAQAESLWAQFPAAQEWVENAWSGSLPTDELRKQLADESSLTPGAKMLAMDLLFDRLDRLETQIRSAFNDLTRDQTDSERVREAAMNADLSPRARAALIAKAEAWEYRPPEPSKDQELTEETRRRRLAEASLALAEMLAWDTPPRHLDPGPVERTLTTREEILGPRHQLTAQARWLYGTLIWYQGRLAEGLVLRRAAVDDLAADDETDPKMLIGVTYQLLQAELAAGTLAAADQRLQELILYVEKQLRSGADEALLFDVVQGGDPFTPSYGYDRVLQTPLTSRRADSTDELRARTVEWVNRARRLGLRRLLAEDSTGYYIVDRGSDEEPYGYVIPNERIVDLVRLIPDAIEVRQADSLARLRAGQYQEASELAAEVERANAEAGKPDLAMAVAVRAIAAAKQGDESAARTLRERLTILRRRSAAERGENDPAWWSAIGRSVNSTHVIDLFLREIDDTLAGTRSWPR
ncbi:MAG: serine/threonine-protein kinase [Phycisphaerales bacterium]|jgi:serine/threonine protein kinase/WD40 repeat protein|nr:serine/threonine-protein kinase [Phycisphaerales bacterium]